MSALSRDQVDAVMGALCPALQHVTGAPSDYDPILDVDGTRRVVVERDERGADQALRLETADGTTTIVTFQQSQRPEMLNGV